MPNNWAANAPHVKDLNSLPPREELPQPVQDFLKSIEDLPLEEKVSLINTFTQEQLKIDVPDVGTDRFKTFAELLKDPKGDCDDHSQYSAALLKYAGVDPQNILYVMAQVNYKTETMDKSFPHSVLMVKNDDKSAYVLDANMTQTPLADTTGFPKLTYSGEAADDNGKGHLDGIEADVKDFYFVFTAAGHVSVSKPIPAAVAEEMNRMTPAMQAALKPQS